FGRLPCRLRARTTPQEEPPHVVARLRTASRPKSAERLRRAETPAVRALRSLRTAVGRRARRRRRRARRFLGRALQAALRVSRRQRRAAASRLVLSRRGISPALSRPARAARTRRFRRGRVPPASRRRYRRDARREDRRAPEDLPRARPRLARC